MQFLNVLEKNAAAMTFSKTCRGRVAIATAIATRQRQHRYGHLWFAFTN
jgi:hypothetical protein